MTLKMRAVSAGFVLLFLCAWTTPAIPRDQRVRLKHPSLDWSPNIMAEQDMDNQWLQVSVRPLHPQISYLHICVSLTSSIPCQGNVYLMESPNNTLRYRVEGLATNRSYYIYVRPFNKKNEPLDVWLHSRDSLFLKPWPSALTTTTTITTTTQSSTTPYPEKPVVKRKPETLKVVVIVVVVILLLLACPLCGFFCWRKGYLQKILRLCLPHAALHGPPPIRVLQIYVKENQAFHQLVKTHVEYLDHYQNLECVDCEDMRRQPNIEQWLEQVGTVLAYLSPQLTNELLRGQDRGLGRDAPLPNSSLAWKVEHIRQVASRAAGSGRWNRRPAPIVFIFPDCWSQNLQVELRQSAAFKRLPCFSIMSSPGPVLRALSGRAQGWLSMWRLESDGRGETHKNTMKTLLQNIYSNHGQCSDHSLHMNHQAALRPIGDFEFDDPTLEGNGYPCMGTTQGRLGHPHRTDSGFSSSDPEHHRGVSNSSSDQTSHGADRDGEEGVTETDPMIEGVGRNLSVSQMSVFLPPESVPGDVDSVVIFENLRKVNANGDWSS